MKRLVVLLLLAILVAPMIPIPVRASPKVVIAFEFYHAPNTKYLDFIIGNASEQFGDKAQFKKIDKPLDTSGVLDGVDVLFLAQPQGAAAPNYTDSELTAIKNWFEGGSGRVLIVQSDSDYKDGQKSQIQSDRVLEKIGSKLRIDYVSVEDPESNAGAPYRVVGTVFNTGSDKVGSIVKDVTKLLFHGPGVLAVYEGGKMKKFSEVSDPNIVWVVKTSPTGVIRENVASVPGEAYTVGEKGNFVLMGAEFNVGPKKNVVFALGEAFYGSYEPIWSHEYHGVKLSGGTFTLNFISWLINHVESQKQAATTTQPTGAGYTETLITAVILIIIIVAVGAYLMRRYK